MNTLANWTKRALIAAALMAPGAAMAQSETPPAPDPAAVDALVSALPEMPWMRVCGIDQNANVRVCNTRARDVAIAEGIVVTMQVIEVENGNKQITALLPLSVQLPDGVRAQIDDGQQITGRFRICLPQGCVVEIPADENTIASMKRGSNFVITAINQQGRAVPFQFSLSGFTAAYDGEPIDPFVLRAAQERLIQQQIETQRGGAGANPDLQGGLDRRAEELRQRLQGGGTQQ
ncbi:MAG: invasion associated locus B family protein [Hyphomicrobiaceae bacterium]|nr:invasion associated locus B family protein [Hyphomicrobiaceae bacterium]